jgi:hypothetical protein
MKIRSPLVVVLLSIVTLGLYFYYWFYKVNKEAATISRDRQARPFVSFLALSLGSFLLIPFLWTLWTTAARVGRATNSPPSTSDNFLISVLLSPFVLIVYAVWIQGKLNSFGRGVQAKQRDAEAMRSLQGLQSSVVRVQAEIQPQRTP